MEFFHRRVLIDGVVDIQPIDQVVHSVCNPVDPAETLVQRLAVVLGNLLFITRRIRGVGYLFTHTNPLSGYSVIIDRVEFQVPEMPALQASVVSANFPSTY